ncbi:MAG: molybdenum cofactor biosynthesis protein B [Polyangiales bacterium]
MVHAHAHAHHRHDVGTIAAAVITVSDTRTIADDASGAAIVEALRAAGHETSLRLLVRDDRVEITRALDVALAQHARLIVLTGGTGIAPRDVTIEAIAPRFDKTLDGFGEALRRLSWDQVGAKSILSRAVAGTIGRALVVALPGSERGVELAMTELVVPIARHAIGLLGD